ncbi:MAG TPA: DUF58 domain-containing protein [Elusimicrobia bacterium]|nr:MAG: hypothetical protein A2X37_01660 [Elusimicrobia bacterium GWA2_66_18]OGR69439.1 MAG: hypothetical protein A2X40_00510 [Elusimicrobia bacterium GWC2_65_9]HAZ08227.1 DUF58 domain-containing protein [Elusimicrobiota bacterium]
MLPQEILAQVRRLEITTGRLVAESFAGDYLSVFKGRGMEFSDVREYAPGDDPRDIDRNVSARAGKPFVRRYVEERELTVIVAVDLSGSQSFGTADRLKRDSAVEIGAAVAFAALQNNDKVGLALFTDEVELFVPPRKGRRHALAVVREILAFEPTRKTTSLGVSLERLARMLKRRCILVLVSDFRDRGFERALKLCAVKHDLIPVVIEDPREARLPAASAVLEVFDPETGARESIDLRARTAALAREEAERRAGLLKTFRVCGLEPVISPTDKPSIEPLISFFRRRARRRGR